jgi:Fe2+ transport system protein FeoA
MKTMTEVHRGRTGTVSGFGKGRGFRAKMMAIGIRPGAEIKVVSGSGDGPRVVQIGRQRIMIGAEMLKFIYLNEGDFSNECN